MNALNDADVSDHARVLRPVVESDVESQLVKKTFKKEKVVSRRRPPIVLSEVRVEIGFDH